MQTSGYTEARIIALLRQAESGVQWLSCAVRPG